MLKPSNKTRIMVFGTFDGLHKGHLHFFEQARKLAQNSYLIVSIARDVNVKKIKGRPPRQSERIRLANVKRLKVADQVTLGNKTDYLSHIIKIRPQIIALGYDQSAYTKNLRLLLEQKGLRVKIARLKSHKPHIYKSSLKKNPGVSRSP